MRLRCEAPGTPLPGSRHPAFRDVRDVRDVSLCGSPGTNIPSCRSFDEPVNFTKGNKKKENVCPIHTDGIAPLTKPNGRNLYVCVHAEAAGARILSSPGVGSDLESHVNDIHISLFIRHTNGHAHTLHSVHSAQCSPALVSDEI